VCFGNPALVSSFESLLISPFQDILMNEVAEFMPYVFQILSQLLNLHKETGIPAFYQEMLPPILQPTLWEKPGNVPALVNLLASYPKKDANFVSQAQKLPAFLGVCQKLISSRLNDHHGLYLLSKVIESMPSSEIISFMPNIMVLLLTRLSQSKTPKFSKGFLIFVSQLINFEKQGFSCDDIIAIFDTIQTK
jgi:exportin-2 (importin alpha re-exporter)